MFFDLQISDQWFSAGAQKINNVCVIDIINE